MKLNKPKFWDTKFSLTVIFFIPITLVTLLVNVVKRKFTKSIKFNIPIICIGNIYIGGTGKTPTSIYIGKELTKLGKKPAILRKFYKDHEDEYLLIRKHFKSLIINKSRATAVEEAEKKNFDSVILDDGFQDHKIKKNLNILCFNENQFIGNGFVLPAGPLRENLSSLKRAEIILINGNKNVGFENKILNVNRNLSIFYAKYKPENIDEFKNKRLLAVAGIGNPNNFFKLLLDNNLNIEKKLIFPDHYQFSKNEIKNIVNEAYKNNYEIIMTEKDYFKVKNFNLEKIRYLKVSLEINDKERFFKKITKLYD